MICSDPITHFPLLFPDERLLRLASCNVFALWCHLKFTNVVPKNFISRDRNMNGCLMNCINVMFARIWRNNIYQREGGVLFSKISCILEVQKTESRCNVLNMRDCVSSVYSSSRKRVEATVYSILVFLTKFEVVG